MQIKKIEIKRTRKGVTLETGKFSARATAKKHHSLDLGMTEFQNRSDSFLDILLFSLVLFGYFIKTIHFPLGKN